MTTYAVTGATGGLGAAAVAALRDRGVPAADIVAVVRDAAKAQDLAADGVVVRVAPYEDPDALAAALAGVDRLLLVSSPTVGQRTAQHTNVINAAAAAGVGVIAYTSLLNAPDSPLGLADEHRETEALLAEFGGDHILLRNGWYWENFLANVEPAAASGTLLGAAGDGRVAGAARAELGEAAAAALIDGSPAVYELGGPSASYADLAAAISTAVGTPVEFRNLPVADYRAALVDAGTPEGLADFLAYTDAGIAQGALDTDSPALEQLLGRTPGTFADTLRNSRA